MLIVIGWTGSKFLTVSLPVAKYKKQLCQSNFEWRIIFTKSIVFEHAWLDCSISYFIILQRIATTDSLWAVLHAFILWSPSKVHIYVHRRVFHRLFLKWRWFWPHSWWFWSHLQLGYNKRSSSSIPMLLDNPAGFRSHTASCRPSAPGQSTPRPCSSSTFIRNCENCTFWVWRLDEFFLWPWEAGRSVIPGVLSYLWLGVLGLVWLFMRMDDLWWFNRGNDWTWDSNPGDLGDRPAFDWRAR